MLEIEYQGRKISVGFRVWNYVAPSNFCIEIIDCTNGFLEPFSRLTTNLGVDFCGEPLAFVDVNNNSGYNVLDFIECNGLGIYTGHSFQSGFCVYPLYRFNLGKIGKHLV